MAAAVEHLVFVIHPLLYQALPGDEIVQQSFRNYLASEVEVQERCLAAIERLGPT